HEHQVPSFLATGKDRRDAPNPPTRRRWRSVPRGRSAVADGVERGGGQRGPERRAWRARRTWVSRGVGRERVLALSAASGGLLLARVREPDLLIRSTQRRAAPR